VLDAPAELVAMATEAQDRDEPATRHMSNLLYLVHRLPYPPNKGDKVRSYHLLKHLAARHRVFLGTFIDDPQDEAYVEVVARVFAQMHVARLSPRIAKLRSLRGLLTGSADASLLPQCCSCRPGLIARCENRNRCGGRLFFGHGDVCPGGVTAQTGRFCRRRLAEMDAVCAATPLADVLALPAGGFERLLAFERSVADQAGDRSLSPRPRSICFAALHPSARTTSKPCVTVSMPIIFRRSMTFRHRSTRRKIPSCSPAPWTTGRTLMP
jgi:hypothetical protein